MVVDIPIKVTVDQEIKAKVERGLGKKFPSPSMKRIHSSEFQWPPSLGEP